uniref:Uncharacterized protein n=1 Tax=Arundo donax TaxID=35708 RepID=A0A0A8Z2X5_ARUDO
MIASCFSNTLITNYEFALLFWILHHSKIFAPLSLLDPNFYIPGAVVQTLGATVHTFWKQLGQ